jgi:hypothetical protein
MKPGAWIEDTTNGSDIDERFRFVGYTHFVA